MMNFVCGAVFLQFLFLCDAGRDNQGKEFIIAFIDNKATGSALDLDIFITTISNTPCTVNVTTPGYDDSFFVQLDVTRRTIQKITLPSGLRGNGTSRERKAIWIRSTEEVTVYADNKQTYSTDAFVALPVDILGTEYYVITYKTYPEMVIVGTENGTDVNVTFPVGVGLPISVAYNGTTYGDGETMEISLNRFDTFHINQFSTSADFTGSHIVSSKPIAVFSGNYKVTVPLSSGSSDHLVAQMTSLDTWGMTFSFVSSPARGIGDICRVLTSQDNTTLTVSGMSPQVIALAGDFLELDIATDDYKTISADKPVLVAAFSKTYQMDGFQQGGDPAMSLVVPNRQFGSDYTFSTVETPTGEFLNFLTIIVDDVSKSGLRFDDVALTTVMWTSVPDSGGLVAGSLTFEPGAHNIYHVDPAVVFMAMASGVAQLNSYKYAAGMRLAQVNTVCLPTTTVAGDIIDNDCDGKIDEETSNGIDDDGDGLIDEDLAFPPRSDGSWGEWQSWGSCSLTCGIISGLRSRMRNCDNPAPVNNGLYCAGNGTEAEICTPSTPNCPIHGNWSSWGVWSPCIVTCGNGTVARTRSCVNPVAQFNGSDCVGNDTEVGICTSGSDCPADGGWGVWSMKSDCSTSCGGGLQIRSRTCNNPAPGYMGSECVGDYVNITPCSLDPCPGQTAISYSGSCPIRWLACRTSRQCIHFLKRCDCVNDCPDSSDEDPDYANCIPEIAQCDNSAGLQQLSGFGRVLILLTVMVSGYRNF